MDATVKRHPIRGVLWGVPFGIGLTMFLLGQKVISLGTWPPVFTFLIGIVVGVAVAMFAPPKKAKDGPDEGEAVDDASDDGQPVPDGAEGLSEEGPLSPS